MTSRRRVAAIGVALALLTACHRGEPTNGPLSSLSIATSDGPVRLRVQVADTPQEREHGLMGRASLASDQGMAFLWSAPVRERFWMKDTTIPLSVAFWDQQGRIVAILDMAPCRADPCPTYDAGVPYVGAVEANQGYFAEHGVRVGDRVTIAGVT